MNGPRTKFKKHNTSRIKAEEASVERKRQCNSKALQVVIRLSEGVVTEECLIESLQFINQEHYQDVIEERAINKWCGYPLCQNNLKTVPVKQYHISTTHNKVFDITDRKNFCSNLCYKASKYLKDQVSTSPLWARDESHTAYQLISLQSKGGIAGDEVDLGFKHIKTNLEDPKSDVKHSFEPQENPDSVPDTSRPETLEDISSNDSKCSTEPQVNSELNFPSTSKPEIVTHPDCSLRNDDKTVINNLIQDSNISSPCENHCTESKSHFSNVTSSKEYKNTTELSSNKNLYKEISKLPHSSSESPYLNCIDDKSSSPKYTYVSQNNENKVTVDDPTTQIEKEKVKPILKKTAVKSIKHTSKVKSDKQNNKNNLTPVQNIVLKVEQVFKEWFSIDSLCFTYGEEKVKEIFKEKENCIAVYRGIVSSSVNSHVYERYLAICRKLNILELEDTKIDVSYREEDKIKRPLPDYEVLKEEAKNLELKVNMFYKGDRVVHFEEPHGDQKNSVNENVTPEPVLPLVDLHAQKALRRRIVIDKLRRILNDLQNTLGLKSFNLDQEVRKLVSTFTLSAHNITMKPGEWNLIAIIIVKMLSVKDKPLAQALGSASTSKHLTLLLMSYSLDNGYLDRLIVWLTDVEALLKKHE